MAYYRARSYGRHRGKNNTRRIAIRALRLAWKGKPENKAFTFYQSTPLNVPDYGTGSEPTFVLNPYSAITQGDTDSQRNGDAMRVNGFQIRFTINLFGSTDPDPPGVVTGLPGNFIFRCVAFIVKDNPSGVVTQGENLQSYFLGGAFATTNATNVMRSHDNRFSYKTVYDRTWTINQTDLQHKSFTKHLVFNRSLDGHRNVQFTGAGTTITNNQLLVCFWSNKDSAVLVNGGFTYNTQLHFTDA